MTRDRTPSAPITLVKLHGLGNDFLVVLEGSPATRAHAPNPAPVPRDPAAFARRVCDRHLGIGADGLIIGRRIDPPASGSGGCAMSFRLWNADGSEAEMSGNGIRCLAHAALDEGWVGQGETFGVDTLAGRRDVTVRRTAEPETAWADVDMGPVTVDAAQQHRCNVGHGQLAVDVGNPHLVVLGATPDIIDVARLGPILEASEPGGLNVEFVALGPGPDTVTMRVWERGVGETLACGTGACAAAAALHHWGRVGAAVTVNQPGGSVAIKLRPDGGATLAGPSQRIAICTVPA